MKTLNEKIKKSKQIILEAAKKWKNKEICIAWTGGKDSTVLLHLAKTAFNGKVPFLVMFNDSTLEFPEVYQFIKRITKDCELNLI